MNIAPGPLGGGEHDTVRRGQSTLGAFLVMGYVFLMLVVVSPLLRDGYIGHGNGVVFLLAATLTSPLSLLLLLLQDALSDVNAFYLTGWPYVITFGALGVGALYNTGVIYMAVVVIQRTRRRA